jgi:hypothetical protein
MHASDDRLLRTVLRSNAAFSALCAAVLLAVPLTPLGVAVAVAVAAVVASFATFQAVGIRRARVLLA